MILDKDKIKYRLSDFPDKVFLEKYVKAISLKDKVEMMKEYKQITKYVLNKMGGFNINGWKLKSPVEKKG